MIYAINNTVISNSTSATADENSICLADQPLCDDVGRQSNLDQREFLTVQEELVVRFLMERKLATLEEAQQYVLEQSSSTLNMFQKSIQELYRDSDEETGDEMDSDNCNALERQIVDHYLLTKRAVTTALAESVSIVI